MTEKRRLCRSMSDKAILGVCSGFARYFDVDPIVIRLAVVLLALMGTLGVWFYIIAAIIMPKDTDFVFTQQERYDSQTGRPLYEAGGTVYENRAASYGPQETPVQDVEFTATEYSSAKTADPEVKTENPEETAFGRDAEETTGFETSDETAETTTGEAFGTADAGSNTGDTSGTWTSTAQSSSGQPKDDPYKNFQGYQANPQQGQRTYQAYQPQQSQHNSHRSRNTGILLIIIGVVILAKIILPRINIWIPISIASIFFGIYLCCRKK